MSARVWALAAAGLLLVGCGDPRSTGALWAQQNLDNELAGFRETEVQRAARMRAVELGQVEATLTAERARLGAELAACPGARRGPLEVSPGDRVRDGARVRLGPGEPQLTALAQLALADWHLRRAASTGDAEHCARAATALSAGGTAGSAGPEVSGGSSGAGAAVRGALARLGVGSVARVRAVAPPGGPVVVADRGAGDALSLYALGFADEVRAAAPLPQYLAAVYGGELRASPPLLPPPGQDAATAVDDFAPQVPTWEPDALFAAYGGFNTP